MPRFEPGQVVLPLFALRRLNLRHLFASPALPPSCELHLAVRRVMQRKRSSVLRWACGREVGRCGTFQKHHPPQVHPHPSRCAPKLPQCSAPGPGCQVYCGMQCYRVYTSAVCFAFASLFQHVALLSVLPCSSHMPWGSSVCSQPCSFSLRSRVKMCIEAGQLLQRAVMRQNDRDK